MLEIFQLSTHSEAIVSWSDYFTKPKKKLGNQMNSPMISQSDTFWTQKEQEMK